MTRPVQRMVSGGQTGADRAALDVALELGIPCGGWCPRGRRAEDGVIPARYPLQETRSPQDRVRTRWNVRDSEGTLILARGELTGGTLLTRQCALKLPRPLLIVDLVESADPAPVADWLREHTMTVLNIAGPRESQCPGIYERAAEFLRGLLAER
ncbi:MAG: putative molybdenum carrier protein [Planctomycetaceae bacterium]